MPREKTGINAILSIIGGLVALGGGYYLYKKYKEGSNGETTGETPENLVGIHYAHADDAMSAYKLRDLLVEKGYVVNVKYIPGDQTSSAIIQQMLDYPKVISIGAQYVNPLYADAVSRGIVEAAGGSLWFDWGCEEVDRPGNIRLICYIGGDTRSDTFTAVRMFPNESPYYN